MQTVSSKKTIMSIKRNGCQCTGRIRSSRDWAMTQFCKALSCKHEAMHWVLMALHTLSRFWQPCCLRSLEPSAISGSAYSQVYKYGTATRECHLLLTQELQECADKHCTQERDPCSSARVSAAATPARTTSRE